MCLYIDYSIKSLNKRTVWKVFDKARGHIGSLYLGKVYPKNKLIERSKGPCVSEDGRHGTHGLHFYLTKKMAKESAETWTDSYIAKFKVDPTDFMFADGYGQAMYERATRVGNFIKIRGAE